MRVAPTSTPPANPQLSAHGEDPFASVAKWLAIALGLGLFLTNACAVLFVFCFYYRNPPC